MSSEDLHLGEEKCGPHEVVSRGVISIGLTKDEA
jgi:hypothetical protein